MSAADYSYHLDEADPYLAFTGPVSDATPRGFIPFIDTIRRESEWCALGLTPKKDRNGNYKAVVKKGFYYSFRARSCRDAIDIQAIETGKKFTQYPDSVYFLLRQGCCFNDFIPLADDIIEYCECMKFIDHGSLDSALIHITKAFAAKPDHVRYASTYFDVRLQLGDGSSIEEELTYFHQDIDCLIHCGRVYAWLKYLSSTKDYVGLDNTVKKVDQFLDDLIAGRTQNRRYTPQRVEIYEHEKEQFLQKTQSLRKRIESALTKAPRF